MFRWLVLAIAASVLVLAPAQPTTCTNDTHCAEGFYCLADSHYCHECVSCEQAHREPPANQISCIKSVVDCGPCIKGLEYSVDSGCSAETQSDSLPAYMWAVIVICLLLFALIVGALFFWILRHTDTFKVLASSSTSVQAPVVRNGAPPSAPAPPPYYSGDYAPVRPSSPFVPPTPLSEDSSFPLVKRASVPPGPAGAREAAGREAAVPYNNPSYVRNAQLPPSYDSAFSDESDHETPFVPHDEETMESEWTPATDNESSNAGNSEAAAAGSAMVSAGAAGGAAGGGGATSFSGALRRHARADALAPPAKLLRTTEDTNNNRNQPGPSGSDSSPPPAHPPPPPPAPAASLVINVLNVNSVRQLNDISL